MKPETSYVDSFHAVAGRLSGKGADTPMSNENMTPNVVQTRAPEDAPALVKKIGKTTYKVRIHFSDASTETMSDKIKRMLKNEIQQM